MMVIYFYKFFNINFKCIRFVIFPISDTKYNIFLTQHILDLNDCALQEKNYVEMQNREKGTKMRLPSAICSHYRDV